MPIRQSTAARAAPRALRAIDGASETTNIEPFDDVSEPGTPDHAERAQGLNSVNGATHAGASTSRADASNVNANHANTNNTNDTQHEPLSPDDPLAPLPFNPYKGNRGLTRAWHAMKNSLAGFRVAIREESAFRQELTLAAILIPCGVLVPVEPVSRVLLLGSVLLVLIVELLNSSVEAAIDRISLERHELSRRAKDLGSAAVMVALGMCVMTWGLIVGPLVVHWIGRW
ncbi:diacylglycerol kinase [Paraburkholderia sp. BCC1876]|uniref:diacylglycerol kinase n=1 Tax=Paraburkholderia sp. BCC1876 TaxID=2676303 RepID=UPI001591B0CF|nr:diacylglycerol kinase [Paraburkholderia sp. BCC1876]